MSPLTSLMIELATKFKIQGIVSEFVGELQRDVDAMIQVKSGKIHVALTGRTFLPSKLVCYP